MAKNDDPSGQSWSTFLRNHAPHIAAMDSFVVPSIGFVQLHVLDWHPTAEWIAQQITEVFVWNEAPRYFDRKSGPVDRYTAEPCL